MVAPRLLLVLILILTNKQVQCLTESEGFTLNVLREALMIPHILCLVILHIPMSVDVVDFLLIISFLFIPGRNLLIVLNLLSCSFLHDEDFPLVVF